ncbi:MAG: NnrU family protein [Candidatus Thiodiazotropha sp.]
MILLLAGLALLIGVHLIPSFPALRMRLAGGLGEWPYMGAFALVSLIGLYFIITGFADAPVVELWHPPEWSRIVPQALMLPAFILLVAAYVPGNLKRLTPNPMLWGVTLWSASHLAANGDLAGSILFGALGLYALYAIRSGKRRGISRVQKRGPVLGDFIALTGGTALYIFVFMNHATLFGVAIGA